MNPHIDLIYFLSSLVMVVFPLVVFTVLTYYAIKGHFRSVREKREGRGS